MKKVYLAGLLALVVFCLLGSPAESKRTTIDPPASADLSIIKTGPASGNTNSQISYTITITNSGPDAATNASWSDTLPSSLLFLSLSQDTGPSMTCTTPEGGSNGPINCSIASLPVGSAQFTLNVLIASGTPAGSNISNTATATSSTSDPNGGNNSGNANTTALSPALLSGLKSVSGTKTPGSTITYEVTIKNGTAASDQQDNPGDEFTDVLPSQLTLVSADASGGTVSANTGTNTVTWNGVIPSGESVTITISATIHAGN